MSLQQFKEDFISFVEAGFIAINQSDEDSTIKLFKAAKLLDSKNILPVIGVGYLHLQKLEIKSAIQKFEEALKMEPKNDMAKAFLGIAKSFSAKDVEDGESILKEVQKTSEDKDIKKLSTTAIHFVEKCVKKSPTPTQGMKKKKG